MSKWSSAFRDSRWQKLRLEVMERDNWTCRSCGKKDGVTLNVHHAYYEAGKAPWEYPKETLITFCEECHSAFHSGQKVLLQNIIVALYHNATVKTVFSETCGFLNGSFSRGSTGTGSTRYNSGFARALVKVSDDEAKAITESHLHSSKGAGNQ